MPRKTATLLILLALALAVVFLFVYLRQSYLPKYSWYENYSKTSDQPYGLKLFYQVINRQKSPLTILYNRNYQSLDTNQSNANLIYAGYEYDIDSVDAGYLLKFVEKGNRVFVASNIMPLKILREFVPVGDSIYGCTTREDSIIYLSYVDRKLPYPATLRFNYQRLKDTVTTNWSVYNQTYFTRLENDFGFKPFSYINDTSINAFYIPHGKGRFYFHTNPVLFTNYYLVQEKGYRHTVNILSQLHQGPVIWDEPYTYKPNTDGAVRSPLKFLFSHPYLKAAWYLLLVTILLYLLFRSKREQRIIPLLPRNENSTIAYVKAIGTLYFKSGEQKFMANEMYMVFLADVRSRYNLVTNIQEADLIKQLATRSGVNIRIIENLFIKFRKVRSESTSGDDLIELYNAIENFNRKRK